MLDNQSDAEVTEIVSIEWENDRSISVVEIENPEPECDTIGVVADNELILALTPDEFVEFTLLCVRALGTRFDFVMELLK